MPNKSNNEIIVGDFNEWKTDQKFDLVWCSHVLEHQKNVNLFLRKCYNLVATDGFLCITVPPLKHNIVGGHLTLWNMGILIYNMVIAGIDCSSSMGKCYGYNISVIVRKTPLIDIDKLDLLYDNGDLSKLQKYFPWKIKQNDDGNIKRINWK